MPSVGFEPTISAGERPQTYALDRAATGAGSIINIRIEIVQTFKNIDDWLTVHRSIILVYLQLDAQNSYLFTYNTFIKILYMFRALRCLSSGGLRRNCIYVASGIVTLCR